MSKSQKPTADSSVRQLFRESYFKFMDDCEKLWQQHCETLRDLSSNAPRRAAEVVDKGSLQQDVSNLSEQADQEYRAHRDSVRSNLESIFKDYAKGTAGAWEVARDQGIDEVTLWHVGIAQMNVAWNYSMLSAYCRA